MIWIQLSSARGPAECEIAVAQIAAILCQEAQPSSAATIIDSRVSQHGLYSVLIRIEGDNEAAFAASWNGTIQWINPSPLDTKRRRKNWFIAGSVIQPPPAESTLNPNDLRFDTFRASGPGGQHVNTTDSAVRVTHLPTGLIAQAQEERSQYRNKALALSRLAALLAAQVDQAVKHVEQTRWQAHNSLIRGRAIRVYTGENFRRRLTQAELDSRAPQTTAQDI